MPSAAPHHTHHSPRIPLHPSAFCWCFLYILGRPQTGAYPAAAHTSAVQGNRQPSRSCVCSNGWIFEIKGENWSYLWFRYNLISLNAQLDITEMVLVSLCLLARAELLLLSWPNLKTSKSPGLSVFSHSSRFVQKTPCVLLQQPASAVLHVISLLSGPASQEVQACTFVWHLTPLGLPQHSLWRALCKMWAFPNSAVSLLWKLWRPVSSGHTNPAKMQATSKETNQPCTKHQSLPEQLSRIGRQGFVAVLFCFRLNCKLFGPSIHFPVFGLIWERLRKLNYKSRRWSFNHNHFSSRDQEHMFELMDSFH